MDFFFFFEYVDYWPKILLFRTHHLLNSTTELIPLGKISDYVYYWYIYRLKRESQKISKNRSLRLLFLNMFLLQSYIRLYSTIFDFWWLLQVNNYEIVVNFFHISHDLTWYSAIVHKFARIYPVCSTYELTKQFM